MQEFSVKQWAIVLACLEYAREALELGQRQVGKDQFEIEDLEIIIQDMKKALKPYTRRK